ncbi:uncharacterized protein [Paramisgurnus dabryanus]|uniref:uncharacterized protein n=1 Tax=Paramisgurnus dabryanus TaxID=90735 RepID=UPI003CCF5D9F
MTQIGESRTEANQLTNLLTIKATTKIGTWNVRTMHETGKAAQVASEMNRYNIQVLGICECRWNGSGMTSLASGEKILYSGHADENHDHTEGVAIMMSPVAAKTLMEWQPVSSRIMTARFNSKGRKVTLIQCYSPTNDADKEAKENFYNSLQTVVNELPKRDIKILMGDLNAKIGKDNLGKELIMGTQALGEMNENGELFTDFCAFNDLVIGGSVFQHKDIHKETWISPDGNTKNQIDYIKISRKWRRSLQDTRSQRGADVASDHHLVIGTIKVKLRAFRDIANRPHIKFNTQWLKEKDYRDTFSASLKNRFEALNLVTEETPLEEHWSSLRDTLTDTCQEVLGKREWTTKEWLSSDTWQLIKSRKDIKQQINSNKNEEEKKVLRDKYTQINKKVKKSARKDKRLFYDALATEAEQAAGKRDLSTLYKVTKTLSTKKTNVDKPVKDRVGNPISKEKDQRQRWADHFKELLNQPLPSERPDIPPADSPLKVNTNPPTKAEILKALKILKNGKAAGPDGIPPEALKADLSTTVNMLLPLLQKVWRVGRVPADWKKGHMVKLPKKGDLGSCNNWRGIMLLSVPSKVLTRIILDRLKDAVEEKLRPEQAGFRKEKSCTDQIATLRIIIEQSLEWQSPLYLNFIDFRQAFDSVDRETIWQLLNHYGIPQSFITLIQQLYEGATCQIIHNGKLTEEFEVRTGVRQGCMLSPMIFLLVVDWVMHQTTKTGKTGIQWSINQSLEDLDFADDLCLMSQKCQHMQQKTDNLVHEASKTGLQINLEKTVIMTLFKKQQQPITLGDSELKEVTSFTYLGSMVSARGGSDEDIKARIGKARYAFITLRPVWRSTSLSVRNKIRIFNSNVKSVLLYGSETWRVTNTLTNKLQVFVNGCLRSLLKIRWTDKLTNTDLWQRTNQDPIKQQIARRKWRWIGHPLLKPPQDITRQALQWNPQGKRRVGRPKTTWRRSCEEEMKKCNLSWGELKKAVQNRLRWRAVVEALCSTGNPRR